MSAHEHAARPPVKPRAPEPARGDGPAPEAPREAWHGLSLGLTAPGTPAAQAEEPDARHDDARQAMSAAFGRSFDDVALHDDERSHARAAELGARAFSDGQSVGFGHGVFDPHSAAGRHTLAHEFAHVVQARGGSGGRLTGPPSVSGRVGARAEPSTAGARRAALERDAGAAADAVERGQRPAVAPGGFAGVLHEDPPAPPPPDGGFRIDHEAESGDYLFTITGKTLKSWKDPLKEAFINYVMLAYGAGRAIAEPCAAAAKLHWDVAPNPADHKDTDQITISVDGAAQREAANWMSKNHPELKLVPPSSGSYAAPPKTGGGGSGTSQARSTGSDPDGVAIQQIEPEGALSFSPEYVPFVVGSAVNAVFQFTGTNDVTIYNYHPFNRRVVFDWTIRKDGKVVDTGPLIELDGGDISYSFNVSEEGTYDVSVELSSRYFIGNKKLTRSRTLTVVKEEKRRQDAFDQTHVGPEAGKPFERTAAGELQLKAGASQRSIDDEILELNVQLGAIQAAAQRGTIKADDAQKYVEYFQSQIDTLKGLQTKTAGQSKYVVAGVFVNREDSSTRDVRAVMHGRRLARDGDTVRYTVVAHDFTLTPGEAIQHAGSGSATVSGGDEKAAYAAAEAAAIADMASDWKYYNDYPDGTVQLGIGLLEGSGVKTVVIDTWNVKKPAKKVLTGVVIAGSIALLAVSGGTAAPVTVLVLEGVTLAAGAALTADSIVTRIQNGTFKADYKLVLDMLSLVPLAGTLARGVGLATTRGLLLLNVAVGGASFVLIAAETRQALNGTMASYAAKIERAGTQAEKDALAKERDEMIARILGGAAVSGGLVLVMTAMGAKQAMTAGGGKGAPAGELPPGAKPPAPGGELPPAAEVPPAAQPPAAAKPQAPAAAEAPPAAKPQAPAAAEAPPAAKPQAPAAADAPPAQPPAAAEAPPAAKPQAPAAAEAPPAQPPAAAEAPPAAKPQAPAAAEAPPAQPPAAGEAPPAAKPQAPAASEAPPAQPPAAGEAPPAAKPQTPTAAEAPPAQTPAPTAPKVQTTGENWGIPEGCIPARARIGRKGVTVPKYVKDNPDMYYYNPATGKYPRRIGFPMVEGQGHAIPCFPAGTPVLTPFGPRAIESLRAGDAVLAFDEWTGAAARRHVLELHVHAAERLWRIATAEGEVEATGDHRFWVAPGEYRAARELQPGTPLRRAYAGSHVVSVEARDVPSQATYNLTVEHDFNYFVGQAGLLVHNDGPFVIYLGRDPKTQRVVYVGQTEQALTTRQSQHRTEALAEPAKYAGKENMVLEYAKGPDGNPLTNLSQEEAFYWERKIYDRELATNPDLVNRQVPYTDEKMAEVIKKNCK